MPQKMAFIYYSCEKCGLIRSRGFMARIIGDNRTGNSVAIQEDPEPIEGTLVRFDDEEWTLPAVEHLAVFTRMKVTVDGQPWP